MVKDPTTRKLNRKIDRQKKARMRQNKKLISDSTNLSAQELVNSHTKKINDLKRRKEHAKRNCVFCRFEDIKKEQFRWLKETNDYYVVLDRAPKVLGHTLVISKEPLDDITKIDSNNPSHVEILKAVSEWSQILKTKLNAEKVYVMTMCDHWEPKEINPYWKEGQEHPRTTEHLHFHLLPRYKEMRTKELAGENMFVRPADHGWKENKAMFRVLKNLLL